MRASPSHHVEENHCHGRFVGKKLLVVFCPEKEVELMEPCDRDQFDKSLPHAELFQQPGKIGGGKPEHLGGLGFLAARKGEHMRNHVLLEVLDG